VSLFILCISLSTRSNMDVLLSNQRPFDCKNVLAMGVFRLENHFDWQFCCRFSLSNTNTEYMYANVASITMHCTCWLTLKLKDQPVKYITTLTLTSYSLAHVPDQIKLFVFVRLMFTLKHSVPSPLSSFTPSLLPTAAQISFNSEPAVALLPKPLLTFYHRTPVRKVGAIHGELKRHTQQERQLSIHRRFYVAVALELSLSNIKILKSPSQGQLSSNIFITPD
jgi:hypothetical protein